jgi:hypothetical protein
MCRLPLAGDLPKLQFASRPTSGMPELPMDSIKSPSPQKVPRRTLAIVGFCAGVITVVLVYLASN